jgi:hypothetical protein
MLLLVSSACHRTIRARAPCLLFMTDANWSDGGINLSATLQRSETCITGFVIGLLSWFAVDNARAARRIPPARADARRRCGIASGTAARRTVRSTQRECARRTPRLRHRERPASTWSPGPRRAAVSSCSPAGPYRSHRTGAVVVQKMLRLTDAVKVVISKRGRDGRWLLLQPNQGRRGSRWSGRISQANGTRSGRFASWARATVVVSLVAIADWRADGVVS